MMLSLLMGACGGDDDGGSTGMPPEISTVAWTQAGGCTAGVGSAVMVVTTATDPDTPAANLSYSGSISGCGSVTSASATITCPQLQTYTGTIFVRDPEDNADSLQIQIEVCQNGSAP